MAELVSASVADLKDAGNAKFAEKDFEAAASLYTQVLTPYANAKRDGAPNACARARVRLSARLPVRLPARPPARPSARPSVSSARTQRRGPLLL